MESLSLALAKRRIGKKRIMSNPEVASPWLTAFQGPVDAVSNTCEARLHYHGRAKLHRPLRAIKPRPGPMLNANIGP